MARVGGVRIESEATHHAETVRPLGRLRIAGLGRPLLRELGGQENGLALRRERDKALQQTSAQPELGPQGAARGEILVQEALKVVHATPPGQTGARARSASRATLA